MRTAFRKHREFEWQGRQGQMVKATILIIHLEQPVERQQSRKQRRDPDDAGADPPQQHRRGTDPERKQNHCEDKEPKDESRVAPLAQGKAQIAPKEADERRHPQPEAAKPAAAANGSSARMLASPISIGVWLEMAMRPPPARWAAIAPSSRRWLS